MRAYLRCMNAATTRKRHGYTQARNLKHGDAIIKSGLRCAVVDPVYWADDTVSFRTSLLRRDSGSVTVDASALVEIG